MNQIFFLKLLLIGYVFFSGWMTKQISKSKCLNRNQKKVNILLIWLIPFIWGLIVRGIINPKGYSIMTKNKRGKNRGKNTDNWESLTGLGDGSEFS